MTTRTTTSVLFLIAIISVAALDGLKFGGQSDSAPVATSAVQADDTRPVVLQAHPDHEGLDCAIITERQFEPNRRAFVMTKELLCQ